MNLNKKYLLYGSIGVAALVGAYYVFGGSSGSTQTTTDTTGASAYPDLTFAAPPIGGSTGSLTGSGAGSGTDALSQLMSAFTGTQAQQLAALDAQKQAQLISASETSFATLLTYLKAHAGLKQIQANIPNIGVIRIGPQPTKIVVKTPPKPKPAPKTNPLPKPHINA